MKLEAGMYCYEKNNRKAGIGEISAFEKHQNVVIVYKKVIRLVTIGNVEASYDIVDLIKVGDYVNGEKVTSAEPVDKNDTDRYLGFGDYDYYIHTSEDIKDVVTKEQFESMKYIVEREDQVNE